MVIDSGKTGGVLVEVPPLHKSSAGNLLTNHTTPNIPRRRDNQSKVHIMPRGNSDNSPQIAITTQVCLQADILENREDRIGSLRMVKPPEIIQSPNIDGIFEGGQQEFTM